MKTRNQIAQDALQLLVDRCPRLAGTCYWAGTSSIAIEELGHRESFDLDFHTHKALQDVRPILAEIQAAFADDFRLIQAPDQYGSSFHGVLKLGTGDKITIEVLANYQDVPARDLVDARTAPAMKRVSMLRYLADKIQCVAERAEARDLVDIKAVLRKHPEMQDQARNLLAQQDPLMMAERLLAWSDEELEKDLKAYPEVSPSDAGEARDLLLAWLKSIAAPEEA